MIAKTDIKFNTNIGKRKVWLAETEDNIGQNVLSHHERFQVLKLSISVVFSKKKKCSATTVTYFASIFDYPRNTRVFNPLEGRKACHGEVQEVRRQ